jgi:ElaB/YqjD/DUF883 family membrane-anchored ribosome-binding protein
MAPMRDREEIEREMFEARQDLEQNLDQVVHRAKEKTEVRAQLEHKVQLFVDKQPLKAVGGAFAVGAVLGLLRRL